jgi:tetratricopeptide (TPR) repeat protein|tara:strand:+ start:192 stop:1595 length:1404 start_codon:yes stop_codon:yes gene_type:complete
MKSQDPSLELLQPIVSLFTNGKFQQALSDSNLMLEKFPNSVILCNIAGISNAGLMQFDDAIDSYKNALKINPHFAEAYYNMGIAQKGAGDLEEAIESYKQALKIKPNYVEAYYNMGNLLKDKGDLEEAIESYKQALKIKPDHAEAYNNIGITLEDNGDLEGAIDSYKQAIKINSDFAEAKVNLISLLSSYVPQKDNPNLIVKVNEEIRKIDIKNNISNIISDSKIVSLFSRSQDYISSFDLELKTKEDQIFRGKSMNCTRHLSIFDKHDAIPEFCFSCYKVQVEPSSIIELIKLFIIFDQLKLHENNTRKCMIELRPELSGFYKGLIYCSDLNQANEISEHLNLILKQSIGPELNSSVKRGCSQYAISYPDYKEINNSGPQLMNYNEVWRVIEESHDKKNLTHINKVSRAKLSGLNLSDVLIIRKWIDYAKGIGDPSANLLNQNTVHYQLIHDRAKARLNTFQLTTL